MLRLCTPTSRPHPPVAPKTAGELIPALLAALAGVEGGATRLERCSVPDAQLAAAVQGVLGKAAAVTTVLQALASPAFHSAALASGVTADAADASAGSILHALDHHVSSMTGGGLGKVVSAGALAAVLDVCEAPHVSLKNK
jgi:hypothetical protein